MPVTAEAPASQPNPRGGPHTREGKDRSRQNAMKHGMTSKKLVPNILKAERVKLYRKEFASYFRPTNIAERVLVDELARHTAMMELAEQGEGAVLRHGAMELSAVVGQGDPKGESFEDAILAATFATDALDKFSRYRKGHEKAFYLALKQLLEIQGAAEQKKTPQDSALPPTARLETEKECIEFLQKRFSQSGWRCPHCESDFGSWLERKQRWECRNCRRQVGLRYGTVLERSRLPILTWLQAIQLVRRQPEVSTEDASKILGIARLATVSSMLSKIREAGLSPHASQLLAGLGPVGIPRK